MAEIVLIFTAISSFVGTAGAAITAGVAGLSAWTGLSPFLIQAIGGLVLGIGVQLLSGLFVKKPQTPTIEASKVNVRIAEPERWWHGGQSRSGGAVLFAEFDSDGNFWYLLVHSDSILTSVHRRYFDDKEINIDGSGNVVDLDFSLDAGDNIATSGVGRKNMFRIWTRTFTEDNPVPPPVTEFAAAFPTLWTSDHKLVGTTYSVIKINTVAATNRHKVFRWRGSIGVGEPSFSIVLNWSNVYDPRDVSQTLGNRLTYEFTKNPVLIWAAFRTYRYGRGKSESDINWTKIEEMADICDEVILDMNDDEVVRYQCAIAVPESKERFAAEQEILMACDAQLVFDDDGKCWPRVGYYYAPSLKLVRNRDIVAMESVEAQNGESLTQGVIVRYIDPSARYTAQPSAPWLNPLYYVVGQAPKFLTIDALSIQNHNQAMRLAKSIGLRSQAAHKLLPTTGLRGLKARQERVVNLQYDNTFSGDYEIVTQVEVDAAGVFCGFGCVPIDANRFNLLPGEEVAKPERKQSEDITTIDLPTNVDVQYDNGRIEITFDPTPRVDQSYIFQYQFDNGSPADDAKWSDFSVKMEQSFAFSGTVATNVPYHIRYRTVTTAGKSTDWFNYSSFVTDRFTLSGTPVITGQVSVAYSGFTVGVSGGSSPYIFADVYARLPPGLTVNTATGAVSGTPTTAGTYANIVIRIIDYENYAINFPSFTITISP